ncbi:MAG: LVIVD repeat-containing protein [Actinomycetota bacterium]
MVAASVVLGIAFPSPGVAGPIDQSANVSLVTSFTYDAGTDLAFRGKIVYASSEGESGGVHIYDISGKVPQQVGFVPCGGTQNDVAVVRRGLIALGAFQGSCTGSGVRLIDVKNPGAPKILDQFNIAEGAHTITAYPGEPIIYASPGGLGENGGTEYILDVSDPKDIKLVGEYTPNTFGCHDLSFFFTKEQKLAFCPGQQETEIWDVSDPTSPSLLAEIPPNMEFPHSAVASPDGDLLLIGDENFFTGHDCITEVDPLGAVWVYDISDPSTPVPLGYWSSPRGAVPFGHLATGVCTAHNFNFIAETRMAVIAWYTGGTSVIDFTNPMLPAEVAYFRPGDALTWSSYWYRGLIYANDNTRGLDILKIEL